MEHDTLKVESVAIERLYTSPANPRLNDDAVPHVAASIRRFGWRQPVVAKRTGEVIAGNTRLKAAQSLGLRDVPVVWFEGSDLEATAYAVADNRSHEYSAWDEPALARLLSELRVEDALEGVGYSEQDIDALLADLQQDLVVDGQCNEDEVPEPPDEAVTRPADLWVLCDHRLLCGDSSSAADVDRLLGGRTVQLVNTDPPYNVRVEPRSNNAIAAGLSSFKGSTHHQKLDVARHPEKSTPTHRKLRAKDRPLQNDFVGDEEYERLLHAWFGNLARALEPGGGFYVWGGYANLANYPPVLRTTGLYFSQAIVWVKEHPVLTRKDFMGNFELCQPADTRVLTPSGTTRLGALRDGDRVVSFYPHSSAIVGLREGLEVRVTQRPYDGNIFGVVVGEKQTWCTGGHVWTVRLTEDYPAKWCVYLMRRGEWWRIGVTKMRTTWGFGVKGRLCSEFGEEAWILTLHDSHAEARIREQLISITFGIPQTCWKESPQARRRKSWHIEDLYTRLDLRKLDQLAEATLAAHHRLRQHPFVRAEGTRAKFGSRQSIQVRASNLLPEIMEVPVPLKGQETQWQLIRAIDVQAFSGMVHSLGVDKHEHYIADGIVTHNCFYGWKEGAAHHFYGPNNVTDVWSVKKVNPQSMIHLCLHPDAAVLTEAGYRPIKAIKPGERVYSGDGSFHCVTDVSSHQYTSDRLYQITAKGGNATTAASDNHPLLIWRPTRRGVRIVGGDAGWVRADEVRVGDYTMTPVLVDQGKDPFPERDEEYWFFFGLYLAQGHIQSAGHGERRYPAFSIHKRRQDLVERIWSKWPSTREYDPNDYAPTPSSGLVVMAFDGDAGEQFEALGGRLCHAKRLAPEVFALPPSKRLAVLHGWLDGDGCKVHDRAYWQGSTVSPDLAAHLSLLGESVGYRTSVYSYDPPDDLGGIGNRPFKSRRRVYYLYFYERGQLAKRGSPTWIEHDGREYTLRYVKRVEQVEYEGDVWNLSVEGHPSFQTSVGLTHNTEKPVELARRAIHYSSRPGEHVLDLFGGSGSTLIAAEETKRKAYLMEIDPPYCDVILNRWQTFSGKEAVLESDGRSFAEVATERNVAVEAR
jgi:DNA modification methylase